ncbi:MAG TPA: YceH family protein [Casimicrobiaceae bacterium]|nr:YceH family protein [Casimicrobiaceae bacterium]
MEVMSLPTLSLLETRVLGVLVEKQHTVPDTYPLTLNSLVSGCNQKTSRDPILNATEAEVQAAIDHLNTLTLTVESSGGRVMRYAHNVGRVLAIPSQSVALLATMMLRGPQTTGELRINCERLHHFADISAVEGFLHELAERGAGPLVVELPRQPGTRETRWTHLLCGAPSAAAVVHPSAEGDVVTVSELAAMRANLTEMQGELESIRATVAKLCAELGIAPPEAP